MVQFSWFQTAHLTETLPGKKSELSNHWNFFRNPFQSLDLSSKKSERKRFSVSRKEATASKRQKHRTIFPMIGKNLSKVRKSRQFLQTKKPARMRRMRARGLQFFWQNDLWAK
jgi:hypothetical protein